MEDATRVRSHALLTSLLASVQQLFLPLCRILACAVEVEQLLRVRSSLEVGRHRERSTE
jgi:hypothetical protein